MAGCTSGRLPRSSDDQSGHVVERRVLAGDFDGKRVDVDAKDFARSEQPRGYRQDARATAHVEHSRSGEVTILGEVLDAGQAQARRGMQSGPKRHARIDVDDDITRAGFKFAPGGADDRLSANAQDREVFLPCLGPVLLVHDADREFADRSQLECLEVAQIAPDLLDSGARRGPIDG